MKPLNLKCLWPRSILKTLGVSTTSLNGKKEIVWQHRGYVEGDEEELYTKIVELVK